MIGAIYATRAMVYDGGIWASTAKSFGCAVCEVTKVNGFESLIVEIELGPSQPT